MLLSFIIIMKNQSILFKDKNDLIDKTTIGNLKSVQNIITQAKNLDQAVLPWDAYCTELAKATIKQFISDYNDYKAKRVLIVLIATLLYMSLAWFILDLSLIAKASMFLLFLPVISLFNTGASIAFMNATTLLITEFSLMTIMGYDNIYSIKEYKDRLYALSKDNEVENKLILEKGLCLYNFRKMGNTISSVLEEKEEVISKYIIHNQEQYCEFLLSQYNTTMHIDQNYDRLFKNTFPKEKQSA